MKYIFVIIGFFIFAPLFGQEALYGKFWIEFKDKKESPYQIEEPYKFLSPRAIARREKQGIAIDERDFPVNPNYVESIIQEGGSVHHTSRWLNAATIIIDSNQIIKIRKMPFVKKVIYVGKHINRPNLNLASFYQRDSLIAYEKLPDHYGHGKNQIEMLNGHHLHKKGFRGADKLIAILDGGFRYTDKIPFFDSLYLHNRIIANKDFVDQDSTVYESSTHGSKVLSVMGANLPGLLVGTSPEASYVCIKTEDVRAEYLVEECNWIAGLEYADSIGADIVNSSLGYTTFSDSRMDYTYEDLNGSVSRASIAANIAFEKGMITVCSAGNSGLDSWKYIGIPSDAKEY